jgi:hypothetical protein
MGIEAFKVFDGYRQIVEQIITTVEQRRDTFRCKQLCV